MKLTASKTPLVIAAIATVITLTSFGPASAQSFTVIQDAYSAQEADGAEVINVNSRFKKSRHSAHRGHQSRSHRNRVSRGHRSRVSRSRNHRDFSYRGSSHRNSGFSNHRSERDHDREERRHLKRRLFKKLF